MYASSYQIQIFFELAYLYEFSTSLKKPHITARAQIQYQDTNQ